MRRLVVIIVVVLLGVSSGGIGGRSASAQEDGSLEFCDPGQRDEVVWQGVCQPLSTGDPVPAPLGIDMIMQPYAVYFAEDFAAAPDGGSGEFIPEFMVVVVQDGAFALDVKPDTPGTIVVYGAGNEIPTRGEYKGPSTAENPTEPFYDPTGDVLRDDNGDPCLRACLVPPGTVVQLGPGDRVVADEGALCVYCLIGTNDVSDGETGILEVFVFHPAGTSPDEFSWIESWNAFQGGQASRAIDSPAALGWAYFNPGTRCKDG